MWSSVTPAPLRLCLGSVYLFIGSGFRGPIPAGIFSSTNKNQQETERVWIENRFLETRKDLNVLQGTCARSPSKKRLVGLGTKNASVMRA